MIVLHTTSTNFAFVSSLLKLLVGSLILLKLTTAIVRSMGAQVFLNLSVETFLSNWVLSLLAPYKVLLLTLKAAAPSVGRFMICTIILFVGYLLCGWIVLGPYHHKVTRGTISLEEDTTSLHLRRKKVSVDVELTLNNKRLKQESSIKYLGIFVDSCLSWKTHVEYISKKSKEILEYYANYDFIFRPVSL